MARSLWKESRSSSYPELSGDSGPHEFDAVVVGGGITGVTAAFFLQEAGYQTCLVERYRLGAGDTGSTTAHLTAVPDLRFTQMPEGLWEAGIFAIDTIESLVDRLGIRCEFERVPGYLHAPLVSPSSSHVSDVRPELWAQAQAAQKLGIPVSLQDPVPVVGRPGLRVEGQAKFHPIQYLLGLAQAFRERGGTIYECTEITRFESSEGRSRIGLWSGEIRLQCSYTVVSTHMPVVGLENLLSATLLQTKLAAYSSYVLGGRLRPGAHAPGLFWDLSDPYYYLRIEGGDDAYAIFGGRDHKTGQVDDTQARFNDLGRVFQLVLPEVEIDRHWSGQVIETPDGLPYIGEIATNQFLATGFAGNGMTFGTLAGWMACDALRGQKSVWNGLFSPRRKSLHAGGPLEYLKENVDYPVYFLKDRLRALDRGLPDLGVGEGKVVDIDGERVACSRDSQGEFQAVSAVCPHLGCIVHWNGAERTWDCPCHGSRFAANGDLMAGPAETGLTRKDSKSEQKAVSGMRRD